MTRAEGIELALLTLLAAAAAALLPWSAGGFALSWDLLNHHVYLGLIAEHPRWDLDVLAANYQGYQYPYLYWPVYRLLLADGPGAVYGAIWAAAQAALTVPPLWLVCRRVLPPAGPAWAMVAERALACALGLGSVILLVLFDSTSNDLLATLPLLWAFGIGLGTPMTPRRAALCGALWGVSVAFKFSNGLMLPLLLLWWWAPERPHFGLRRGVALAAGAVGGFVLVYAPWGWQLWQQTGNPFHPFFDAWFGLK